MTDSPKIKVLVVDDSFFMRKLVSEMLGKEKDIEVVGTAKNGAEAIGESLNLRPDVITMDFNMPRMNGAEAVREILSGCRGRLPGIVMFSAYTKSGAEATLESLRAGAVDFVTKPSGELSLDIHKVRDELLEKVRVAARADVQAHKKAAESKAISPQKKHKGSVKNLVVIGSSTGGPPLVEDILMSLPVDFLGAVLVVQHMPEYFTKKFAQRLDKLTSFQIKEALDGERIDRGDILIAPGNKFTDIVYQKDKKSFYIKTSDAATDKKSLTSIDRAMTSAAQAFGGSSIGVILSGMGKDGLEGMRAIKEAGGYTIVQNPESAVVSSMPTTVIENDIAMEILTPAGIAARIIELCEKNK